MSFQLNNFKIKLLSASIAAVLIQQSSIALAQDSDAVEEVVVHGIRESQLQSINIKRNAASVVDAITATDIGKLPDATVSDSLQRVPGIQIERSAGEGSKINIRGESNVTTTLNGEQMLSAGSITTVQPDFSDIPATMVSGIEVHKSPEARNLVSGLAGTVDLKTNRPFMLKPGFMAQGKVEATRGSLGKEIDPSISAFAGYNNDGEFGASLGVAHSTSYLADYYAGWDHGLDWTKTPTEATNFAQKALDVSGDKDTNDVFFVPHGHTAQNRYIDRERDSLNASVQYKINTDFTLTGDVFYTKMDEHEYSSAFTIEQKWTDVTGWFSPITKEQHPLYVGVKDSSNVLSPDATANFYTVSDGIYQARGVKSESFTKATNKKALNTNLELNYDNGSNIKAKLRWAHAEGTNDSSESKVDSHIDSGVPTGEFIKSTQKGADGKNLKAANANPWGYDGVWATLPDGTPLENTFKQIPVGVNYQKNTQIWSLPTLPSIDANGNEIAGKTERLGSNFDRYIAKSTNLVGTFTNADMDTLRFDGSYEFDENLFNVFSSIDVGARTSKREVKKDGWIGGLARTNQYGDAYLVRWQDTAIGAPDTGESFIDPASVSFKTLEAKGMVKGVSDFYGTKGLGTIYVVDPKAMKNPIAWHDQIYGTHVLTPDAGNVYDITDKTNSAYVQFNMDSTLFGLHYRGNLGLRYIETEFETTQSVALPGTVATFNGQKYLLGEGMLKPDGEKITAVNQYNDLLPSVNFILDITDDQVIRATYSKTVATHNTDDLGGGLSVNRTKECKLFKPDGSEVFCATGGSQGGNPMLEPNRLTTMDLSYEWYFSESSMISLGLFSIEHTNSIITKEVARTDIVDSDGVFRGYNPNFTSDADKFRTFIPIYSKVTEKSSGAKTGFEASYKQSFDFLDGFFNPFGLDASYTYSPGDTKDTDYYGSIMPNYGSSRHQYNLALWYEKDGLQIRVAQNYRSEMVRSRGTYNLVSYIEPTSYIDASINYDINENITLSFQGNNLTQEHQDRYVQWGSNFEGSYYNERRLTLGLQLKY